MVQGSDGARLALEALAESASAANLDGDVAIQARIASAIHFAHPTGADGGEDLVGAQPFSRGQGHMG